jgi:hypothetical protein
MRLSWGSTCVKKFLLITQIINTLVVSYDATALTGPGPHLFRGYKITYATHSVGLLWTSDRPDAVSST